MPCTTAMDCIEPGPPPSPQYPWPLECIEGQCVGTAACTSDADCAGEGFNTACNVETGNCSFPCATTVDCEASPVPWELVCDTALGVCGVPPCTSDADCDPGLTCFSDGVCSEPCIDTATCAAEWAWTGPESFSCALGYCEYIGCSSDAQCEEYTGVPGSVCG